MNLVRYLRGARIGSVPGLANMRIAGPPPGPPPASPPNLLRIFIVLKKSPLFSTARCRFVISRNTWYRKSASTQPTGASQVVVSLSNLRYRTSTGAPVPAEEAFLPAKKRRPRGVRHALRAARGAACAAGRVRSAPWLISQWPPASNFSVAFLSRLIHLHNPFLITSRICLAFFRQHRKHARRDGA